MTDFIISSFKELKNNLSVFFVDKTYHIGFTDKNYQLFSKENIKNIVINDLITKNNINESNIQSLKGNFYLIKTQKDSIELYNNMFSIMPIYYTKDKKIFSNSIELIKKHYDKELTTDKQFILESLLFNYSFSDRTLYNEIKLLPCNSFVRINNEEVSIIKHTEITDYFAEKPLKGKKVRKQLAEKFIETTKLYFPTQKFSITFTGGFDGRTLVACAKHFKKKIRTCSVGSPENKDVIIPENNAKKLDLVYESYDLLSQDYLQKDYLKHSQQINNLNPGFNGYIYPHFSYLAKKEAEHTDYLMTGYFGSELFRALHIGGAVTSDILVKIFSQLEFSELEKYIRSSQRLKSLKMDLFKTELDNLINEIKEFRDNFPKNYTTNQKFYKYVFEEVFRKLFGIIINSQMQFINVRTPFLDFDFVKEILKTNYAGVNNDFFTHNPLKRVKGQLVYAEIIKRISKELYRCKTGKGYAPRDLLNMIGYFKIILSFLSKKIKKKRVKQDLDSLGILSGINSNLYDIPKVNSSYFMRTKFNFTSSMKESERDTTLNLIALQQYLR